MFFLLKLVERKRGRRPLTITFMLLDVYKPVGRCDLWNSRVFRSLSFLKLLTIPTITVQFLERNSLWIPPPLPAVKKTMVRFADKDIIIKSAEAGPRLGELGGQIRLLCICVVDLHS